MPIFNLQTNVPNDKITPALLKELSKKAAQLLHKPEGYVAVHVQGDQMMSFAGTQDPCAYGVLKSIGGIDGKSNKSHAKALFEIIEQFLAIPGDRMYIEFVNLSASNVAHNGDTFA